MKLFEVIRSAGGGKFVNALATHLPSSGTRLGCRFDAPLLNALTALFEQDEDEPKNR